MACEIVTGKPAGYWREALGSGRGVRDVLANGDLHQYQQFYAMLVGLLQAGIEGKEALIKLVPLRCGQCLGLVDSVHERVTRNVRDLPLVGRVLTLQVQLLRVNCTRCGHCLQHVCWLDRFARMTRAMAQTVALRFMDAAKLLGAWVDDGRGVPSVWD